MKRVREVWKNKCLAEMHSEGFERTSAFNKATQWLIMELSDRNIPFKIINLGAGVKKVTTDIGTDICPKCKGTGRL